MKKYVSLIVDIEKSREYSLSDRNVIQKYIDLCIEVLNEVFAEGIKFKVSFSAGDEIQGLFTDVSVAVMYLRILELLLNPVQIRAGIGVGEWNVRLEQGSSTQQDGPAYHMARTAITEVRKKKTQKYRIKSDKDDVLANYLLNSTWVMKEKQNYMQNMVLFMIEVLYPFVIKGKVDYSLKNVEELLGMKFEYILEKNLTKKIDYQMPVFKNLDKKAMICIEGIYKDGEDEIIIKKSMAEIADILKCTRQNVEGIARRGNLYAIRNLDYGTLQYLKKEYDAE